MQSLLQHIIATASAATGKYLSILHAEKVHGGDINQTYKLVTNEGNFLLKINGLQYEGMLQKEANGLSLLANANHSLKIPTVVFAGVTDTHQFLLMEYLEQGNPSAASAQLLGEGLAALHLNSADHFGLNEDNYIANLQQSNQPCDNWPDFFANHRIQPLLTAAFNNGLCNKEDVQNAEAMYKKLASIFPKEKPALVHGDLWSGNYMHTQNGVPAIFDPAMYYGHREMDIAMTMLFGGFDRRFYEAYISSYALETGWQQRVALYQLYPLLVHLLLFGNAYYDRVRDILISYH